MSKIVCDVCGTSYPETATQCPICGCVRPSDGIAADVQSQEKQNFRSESYTYVKGGRFSKKNVKKRNSQMRSDASADSNSEQSVQPARNEKSDKGLIIAVILLVAAIIAVGIYIAVHYLWPNNADQPLPGNSAQTTVTTDDTVSTVPCTQITIADTQVTLSEIGQTYGFSITVTPTDTTDTVSFLSSDETVVTVSQDGQLSAVGEGEAVITVTCGQASATCFVLCSIEDPTEDTTVPETTVPQVQYAEPYKLTKDDVSINPGETFILKLVDANGVEIPATMTAEHTTVCTVEGNTVTGVAAGRTDVLVTYGGQTFKCIVRVR